MNAALKNTDVAGILKRLGIDSINADAWSGTLGWSKDVAGALLTSANPATGETLAQVRAATVTDYEAVMRSALEAAAAWRSVRALASELQQRGCEVIEALSIEDGGATVISDAAVHCVFVNWTLGLNDAQSHEQALGLLRQVRGRDARVPIFLRKTVSSKRSYPANCSRLMRLVRTAFR